jgi:hypothetical protein
MDAIDGCINTTQSHPISIRFISILSSHLHFDIQSGLFLSGL